MTFSFPGSSVPAKNMQGESLVTGRSPPGASAWWSNGVVKLSEEETVDNAMYLDAPAPSKVEVSLSFTGYLLPIKLTADLAPHKCPAPTGGWLFPFSASDLRVGEYFSASARHWANGGGRGRQIYAHDIGCTGWDASKNAFSGLLPGTDGSKNEHYRIYGKPVRAWRMEPSVRGTTAWMRIRPARFRNPLRTRSAAIISGSSTAMSSMVYTHLQKNSIPDAMKVKGAAVKAGQMVGPCREHREFLGTS